MFKLRICCAEFFDSVVCLVRTDSDANMDHPPLAKRRYHADRIHRGDLCFDRSLNLFPDCIPVPRTHIFLGRCTVRHFHLAHPSARHALHLCVSPPYLHRPCLASSTESISRGKMRCGEHFSLSQSIQSNLSDGTHATHVKFRRSMEECADIAFWRSPRFVSRVFFRVCSNLCKFQCTVA